MEITLPNNRGAFFHTIQYRKVGALGFEPRSAGFFHAGSYPARTNGSSLQLLITGSENPLAITPN
jgi:hypothetical protein